MAKQDDTLAPPPLSRSSSKQENSLQPDSLPHRPLFNSRDPAICPFWLYDNDCNRGSNCKFLHKDDPSFAVAPRPNRKGETCKFWAQGYCSKTSKQCLYLHGYSGGMPEETNVPEPVQQSEPSVPSPMIGDVAPILTGRRKSVSFADDEPMVFPEVTERFGGEALAWIRDVPDQVRTMAGSNHVQLDAANTSSTDQGRPEVVPPKLKRPGSTISMDSYRRQKAIKDLGDRRKEVIFGKDESKSIVADFGDLTLTKQHVWAQSFAGVNRLHFRTICLAQDFKAQFGSLQHQTLWQGSLRSSTTDDESLKTMGKAWEQLHLSSAGLLAVCPDFVILVYPAIEEWKFVEGSANFSPEMRLRYLVFEANLDFR